MNHDNHSGNSSSASAAHEPLQYRIADGDASVSDPELAALEAALDQLGQTERGVPDATFESRLLASISLASGTRRRSTGWLRLAAAIALASGILVAWSIVEHGSTSGSPEIHAANPSDAGANGTDYAAWHAEVADLVLANLDDEVSSEIDGLISETESLDSRLRSDWFEGGAM
jgi:hypothetical protein